MLMKFLYYHGIHKYSKTLSGAIIIFNIYISHRDLSNFLLFFN